MVFVKEPMPTMRCADCDRRGVAGGNLFPEPDEGERTRCAACGGLAYVEPVDDVCCLVCDGSGWNHRAGVSCGACDGTGLEGNRTSRRAAEASHAQTPRAPTWLPMWERPAPGKHRTARHPNGRIRFTVESKGCRLRYLWPLPACPQAARWLLRMEYKRLAAGDSNRVVEHEPRLSPTQLAALGGNRTIGRDSLGWDYDPDEVL